MSVELACLQGIELALGLFGKWVGTNGTDAGIWCAAATIAAVARSSYLSGYSKRPKKACGSQCLEKPKVAALIPERRGAACPTNAASNVNWAYKS
eukprot:6197990-Pleurochrysis_carterae.AAC.5